MKKPGKISEGNVVVIPFPFSNLSGQKRRPALVLASLDGEDIILCQITSVARFDAYSVPLRTSDFSSGSLPVNSVIRPNKLFTADKTLVLYVAGTVNKAVASSVKTGLKEIFRI
ncbi:MAG: type II toxin-antitoxin system PemK/MazF family toxin [Nanoarchaeota archaeon]